MEIHSENSGKIAAEMLYSLMEIHHENADSYAKDVAYS